MGTEINDHVALCYDLPQVIATINLADHLKLGVPGCARDEHLPHAAFGTNDD